MRAPQRVFLIMPIHGKRIQRVQQRMQPDSILLLPAAPAAIRNRDTHFPYRGHSDTIYLTGVNEEELSLAITPQTVHVFAQTRNPERERWVGKVKGHDFLCEQLAAPGLDVFAHDCADFKKVCGDLFRGSKVLYYDFGVYNELDRHFFAALNEMANLSRRGTLGPRTIIRSSEILNECRLFKDEIDLEHMRRAAAISAAAHNKATDFIATYSGALKEYEIKALIEREFMQSGADRLAYPSIVAAGENATVLHYEGSSGTAEPGDFVLIDAGCEVAGYASDITRTTVTGGWAKAEGLKRELYDVVLAAQRAAIDKATPGNSVDEVHRAAVEVLTHGLFSLGLFNRVPQRKQGEKPLSGELTKVASVEQALELEYYNLFYMHRTSHFLGLDVHDVGDYFRQGKSRSLEAGMVITVEPGLYFPPEYDFLENGVRGIGIRIEDDVLVTEKGNEVLTSACRS